MIKKIFYVNDGLDGVVLARGKKQAINLISKAYRISKQDMRRYFKGRDKNESEWWDMEECKGKSGKGKSSILGWCE